MKSLKNHEPKVHDMDVKILSMFNEKKIDSPGKCIYIVYINCLTRKYTFWIKAQFVDNLSNCKSLKKNEKMIERKKVKMLLCTTPWSPAPHPNYFCIRCVHCDIPFPFSLQRPPHLMFAKSHDSIYYGLASLVEMQQNGLAMPVPTNYVDQRHF